VTEKRTNRMAPGNWQDPDRSGDSSLHANPERARLRSSFLGVCRVQGDSFQLMVNRQLPTENRDLAPVTVNC
jgi:hypothetical protein